MRYGAQSTFEIDLPPDVLLADCSSPTGQPLDDPAAAITAALASPLDFPPFSRATVAGDRIALVLDPGLPQTESLVAGVVHALLENGSDANDISIVCTRTNGNVKSRDPASLLPDEIRRGVRVVRHDPTDANSLAYLAATKSGDPIYVNREIGDADVVLPIGKFRLESANGEARAHAGVFPAFFDEATAQRISGSPGRHRHEEAGEATWLLGIHFAIQVVPGRGDSVLQILAGDLNSVAKRGHEICQSAWRFDVPRRASLVVATIDGGQQQQTWENLQRALLVASQAVEDDGAIVICCDMTNVPAPSRQRAVGSPDIERDYGRFTSELPDDDPLSSLVDEVNGHVRVYLLSGLDEDIVEDLGMACIQSTDEIARLAQQHDSCIVVESAQHATVALQDD